MAKLPKSKSKSSLVRSPSAKSSDAALPARPEDSGSDDSSDQDYQEDSADEDEDLQPDLQTDALFLIDKIMSETGELGDDERERIRKDLERLDEEDAANEDNEEEEEENGKEDEEEEEEEEEEEDVPLSEVEYDADADLVPFQKLTVYNRPALTQAVSTTRESGPTAGSDEYDARFWDHLTLTTREPVTMRDVFDDLYREQAFMDQALDAAIRAKAELTKNKIEVSGNVIRVGCVPEGVKGEMVKSTEDGDAENDDQYKRPEPASKNKSLKRKRSGKGKSNDGYDEEFQTMVEQAEAELGNEAQQNTKGRQFGPGSSSGSTKRSKTSGPRTEERREKFKPGRGGSASEGRHRGGSAGGPQSRRPGASGNSKGTAGGAAGKPKKRLGKSKRSGRP